ncbi:acetyl-CoA carboxylase [Cobetia sp. L2A1]|uniref:acetyl-CoA carboxylase n=1 Tax=Cobetia sp. L2A1 TaxID=2686360 RepID=UPI00131AC089|nr:acetyl-CoA carboxylase [Cobetia sp. L2A1]
MVQHQVTAPLPGVFYRRPSPEADAFAEINSIVQVADTLAVVEVMKQFFELEAGATGRVESFLVEDGSVVEAGQVVAIIVTGEELS